MRHLQLATLLYRGGFMTKVQHRSERGFTLIEMSIVLIIIGLIIGGILKGQELIESSRQKNLQAQVDSIRSAVNNFQDRFKAFPGDYAQANANIGNNAADGNGNGIINPYASGDVLAALIAEDGTAATAAGVENKEFFNHLAAANMIGGVSSIPAATVPTGFSAGGLISPLPSSAYPQSGMTAAYGTHDGTSGTAATQVTITGTWLRVHTFAGVPTAGTAVISPQRAFQFDTKFDETTPMGGRIRTDLLTTDANACGTAAGGGYLPQNTVRNCNIYIALE
jgi:prepilin-type N-terminal cleavage/methylation domain-containing protein